MLLIYWNHRFTGKYSAQTTSGLQIRELKTVRADSGASWGIGESEAARNIRPVFSRHVEARHHRCFVTKKSGTRRSWYLRFAINEAATL